jgi:hypothetical protein
MISDADNSDTDVECLRKEIEGLKKEIGKSGIEGKYRFHLGMGLALIAIGIGVQLSSVGLVGAMPTWVLAFLFYIVGFLKILQAIELCIDLQGKRKGIANFGGVVLLIGAIMLTIPYLGFFTLPTWLTACGTLVAFVGFIVMELSMVGLRRRTD